MTLEFFWHLKSGKDFSCDQAQVSDQVSFWLKKEFRI